MFTNMFTIVLAWILCCFIMRLMCLSVECKWAIIHIQLNKTWDIIHVASFKSLAWLLDPHNSNIPCTSKNPKINNCLSKKVFIWAWIKLSYFHPLFTTILNLWWNRLSGNFISTAKLLATSGYKGAIDGGIEGLAIWLVYLLMSSPIIIPLFSFHDSLCLSF